MDRQPAVIETVSVTATLRNDKPVLQVAGYDIMGDHRTVQLSENAALELLVQLSLFVKQIYSP